MSPPLCEVRGAARAGTPAPATPSTLARVRLAGEILTACVRARVALRARPIDAAVRGLRSKSPPEEDAVSVATLREALRLGRAVARTLRVIPGDSRCLARSLVLTRLLARRGIPAKLVIGTRLEPVFLAHAWVECGGHPVLSPGDGSFARLIEL